MADPLDIARAMVALRPDAFRVPGGQMRDKRGIMWRPSDMEDWRAGGAGRPLPDLTDPATLGAIEHGLLAPAGVVVFRVDRGETIAFLAGPPNRTSGWSVEAPWRTTLAEALLDGLRAVGGSSS